MLTNLEEGGGQNMDKWEYKVQSGDLSSERFTDEMQQWLNGLGSQGWELTFYTASREVDASGYETGRTRYHIVLKRQAS